MVYQNAALSALFKNVIHLRFNIQNKLVDLFFIRVRISKTVNTQD